VALLPWPSRGRGVWQLESAPSSVQGWTRGAKGSIIALLSSRNPLVENPMRCPDCGYEVPEHLSLCPQCGLNVEETQPIKRRRGRKARRSPSLEETLPVAVVHPEGVPSSPTLWQRVRFVLLSFLAFLVLLVVSSAVSIYAGYRQGEIERQARRATVAADHYAKGLAYLDAGEYEQAIAEFRYALQVNPDDPLAAQGLDEAQARLAARPTPTSQAAEDVAADLYSQGEAAFQAEDWEQAIQTLSQLRAFAPEYRRDEVEEMLYTSLYRYGMALLSEEGEEAPLEKGIFYLDQAGQIRPLPEEALWEREMAHRYLTALGYWGVDWERCIQWFEELYALAPGYRDVFQRLVQAHVLYGDMWADQGEMCPAAAQYAGALELWESADVAEKRDQAAEVCAVATPTPIPPITGTLPTTGTYTVPGFRVGRLAYPAYNERTGMYDIYALTADGRLTQVAAGADQPCWLWGSDRLIYRNRLSPGISLIQPGGQPVTLRADPGASSPTLSPDGGRYAYAGEDGYIYIARTDGIGEPEAIAPGWGPAWGPSGLLAWTGCDTEGCGIFVDNPDDDQPPVRLTGDRNDIGLHWHPNGEMLAYMSDHAGDWDIYLLHISGGVQVLVDTPDIEALPAWAPDGSALIFLAYRDDQWGLYLAEPNGENARQIIALGESMPGWRSQRVSWAP